MIEIIVKPVFTRLTAGFVPTILMALLKNSRPKMSQNSDDTMVSQPIIEIL